QLLLPAEARGNSTIPILLGSSGVMIGLLLVPSVVYPLQRLLGHRPSRLVPTSPWLRPTLLIFALPLLLLAGWWISQQGAALQLILPIFHVPAIGIPILWLSYLAVRDLPLGSPQRAWGLLGSGSVLAPLFILFAEVLVLLAGVITWSIWMSGQPGMLDELSILAERLRQAGNSPQLIAHIISPYLKDPLVIFSAFTFAAVIVPLIEEAIKPLGVWFLAGSRLTPAEGFTAGILCGAGYALVESLTLSADSGNDWVSLVFARIGTAVVHILTSGLTGWALASAWREKRYFRLGVTYLGAVLLHGLWNGLTMLIVIADLSLPAAQLGQDLLSQAYQIVPYGLVGLAIAGLATLLWINVRLRRTTDSPQAVV
ncbi:MAG TPA: PrsW family glutamic-type intramembrane protease, partial [Anaerolineales bacterium]